MTVHYRCVTTMALLCWYAATVQQPDHEGTQLVLFIRKPYPPSLPPLSPPATDSSPLPRQRSASGHRQHGTKPEHRGVHRPAHLGNRGGGGCGGFVQNNSLSTANRHGLWNRNGSRAGDGRRIGRRRAECVDRHGARDGLRDVPDVPDSDADPVEELPRSPAPAVQGDAYALAWRVGFGRCSVVFGRGFGAWFERVLGWCCLCTGAHPRGPTWGRWEGRSIDRCQLRTHTRTRSLTGTISSKKIKI